MPDIRACSEGDWPTICEIINDAASAYKGVIPADRWHEPYMPFSEMVAEIGKGVRFHAYRVDGDILGIMGIQDVKDVTLIRHAYTRSARRGEGIGRQLLEYLVRQTQKPILIGTWRAATWAIRFYEKNGFAVVSDQEKNRLLRDYWTVPDRQIKESVVLADARWRNRLIP